MRHKYLKDVTTLALDSSKCVGCELCSEVCPHGVFVNAHVAEKDFCIECGACALNCPVKAIEVKSGVGCAAAFIQGWLTGGEPECCCDGGGFC